jgi:hypothetical protein
VITALGALYMLPDALAHLDTWPLYVMLTHFVLAVIIFLRIAYSNEISPARRVFAQFADVAAISWYLGFFGEAGAFLFLLYIWVTLGSGFRFGARYLISELMMSVVGFGVVILLMIATAVIAYTKVAEMNTNIAAVVDEAYPTIGACDRLMSGVNQSAAALRGYILNAIPQQAEQFKTSRAAGWSWPSTGASGSRPTALPQAGRTARSGSSATGTPRWPSIMT